MKIISSIALVATTLILSALNSASATTSDEVIKELCSSVPSVPEKVKGLTKDGAEAFMEANANLMHVRIIWDDPGKACAIIKVTKIKKVYSATRAKVKAAYNNGISKAWGFGSGSSSGTGTIENGILTLPLRNGISVVLKPIGDSMIAVYKNNRGSTIGYISPVNNGDSTNSVSDN